MVLATRSVHKLGFCTHLCLAICDNFVRKFVTCFECLDLAASGGHFRCCECSESALVSPAETVIKIYSYDNISYGSYLVLGNVAGEVTHVGVPNSTVMCYKP